jgi:phosphopantothenoylcysteine decarboxylase/phosphopantothenate--cysteine ligase
MNAGSAVAPGGRRLDGRLVAVGVTGSIAAYKAADLVRRLQDEGADVVVVLTPSAARFVGPLTWEALTRHPVEADVLALLPDGRIGHIVIADSADAIVVAPATAHWLAAMAAGLSGEAVTAACLATSAPVVVAPAMDGDMWRHPATRANVTRLRDEFGYAIVEPDSGSLASGQSGVGRLAETAAIVEAVVSAVAALAIRQPDPAARPPRRARPPRDADLEGRHVVVSAGGTRERIDPVRFIGNRSTGKMGAALAEAALARGARVTVVAANVEVALPEGAQIVRIESAAELRDALIDLEGTYDALVMAAAVADFTPAAEAPSKLERGAGMILELRPTDDILALVGRRARETATGARRPPILVGFAAETGSLDRARAKVERKGVDLLVANDVAEPGSGFGSDTNRVVILGADGTSDELPLLPKRDVADDILDRVARLLDAPGRGAQIAAPAAEPRHAQEAPA